MTHEIVKPLEPIRQTPEDVASMRHLLAFFGMACEPIKPRVKETTHDAARRQRR